MDRTSNKKSTKTRQSCRLSRHFCNILPEYWRSIQYEYWRRRVHILFSRILWPFQSSGPYYRTQWNSWQVQENLIISCILPDHNEIRLEIKSKGNNRNGANSRLWSSTLLNDERFKFTKLIKSNENENQHTRAFGMLCKGPEKRKSSI